MKAPTRRVALTAMISLILCGGALGVSAKTRIFRRVYDQWVLNNRDHYLPCEQWPAQGEVSQVIEQHQAVIGQIEAAQPGFVGVEMDAATCPGRADLVIWYGWHQDRGVIEQIIDGDRFYGVPYRLHNRIGSVVRPADGQPQRNEGGLMSENRKLVWSWDQALTRLNALVVASTSAGINH